MPARRLERTRGELSRFLKHHRSKLNPSDVGLPLNGRRRTPGLRREEVAALAGVGLTWYTWLEQGRDIGVSESFLLSLSRALRLDDAECCHLFLLAQQRPPPPEAHESVVVPPLIQRLMDDLAERPAYLLNLRWDVIAWNAAADRLFGFARRPRPERNLLRLIFTDPDLRRRLPAWEEEAARLLTQFRCDQAIAPENPALLAQVEALKSLSPAFRRWWDRRPAGERYAHGIGAIRDEPHGLRRFRHERLIVDEYRHLWMVVYFTEAEQHEEAPPATRHAELG